ncbi:MAG: ATPase, T2SS/T4P/T4SS family [Eubacteriales bacterium]|nr:ATPase, T2SS/T4P/T4SS family [Eubacteriales bacterium]
MDLLREWKIDDQGYPVSLRLLSDIVGQRMAQQRGSLSDEAVWGIIEDLVLSHHSLDELSPSKKGEVIRMVFYTLRKELEILHEYAEDPDVSEIMVNGTNGIFIERCGKIERVPVSFESSEDLEKVIRRLAASVGREMNDLHPVVDARLQDGSRINAVNRNIALDGPVLTIRKFNRDRMTLDDLILQKDISPEAAELLGRLVRSGYNMFVSGGTSSGKTTFLNVLSDFIPREERVIVIEDSSELAIRNHENLVRMEARHANAQGRGGVTIRELIKTSLRMRPDRIIVGEVRGEEVVDMLSAMSTGHEGSLSTGHANSPAGMINRLETLFLSSANFPVEAVRSQIAGAIEIFVHLKRTSAGKRQVWEISEVEGYIQGAIRLNKLFAHVPGKGLTATGNRLIHKEKLELYEQEVVL